ncbi:MAG: glucose-6-phosphate isomerase, partial [Acidimicrobiia bacterium]
MAAAVPGSPATGSAAWAALAEEAERIGSRHLRRFFTDDPDRGTTMAAAAGDLYLDYAKQRVTRETIRLLIDLAESAGVAERTEAMFSGDRINTTEDRAVLHVALRTPRTQIIEVDGHDVVPDVHAVLEAMARLAESVRRGGRTGATGERFRTVVNIGIGGSDLGPAMATRALAHYAHPDIAAKFVSNIDGADLVGTLAGADPASTLFIVASKTFTTVETLTNARSARSWLVDRLGEDAVSRHFV